MMQDDLEDINSTEIVSKKRLEDIYQYLHKLIDSAVIKKNLAVQPIHMAEICSRLKKQCDPNIYALAARARDEEGNSLLHVAQQCEDCNVIIFATTKNFLQMDPTVTNKEGFSYLHLAYQAKRLNFIKQIALASRDFVLGINGKDKKMGDTILHYAAKDSDRSYRESVIGFLIENEVADACVENYQGNTPLSLSQEVNLLISEIVSGLKQRDRSEFGFDQDDADSSDGEALTDVEDPPTTANMVGTSLSKLLQSTSMDTTMEIYTLTSMGDLAKEFGW